MLVEYDAVRAPLSDAGTAVALAGADHVGHVDEPDAAGSIRLLLDQDFQSVEVF